MVYQFGGFILNSDPLTLSRDGVIVSLPPKALEILLVLVEREGQIIAKEEIFKLVWPDTHVVESSLTKNISILRKAVDSPDCPTLIENLPKRGYRFTIPSTTTSIVGAPQESTAAKKSWVPFTLLACVVALAAFTYFLVTSKRSTASLLTPADTEVLIGRHHWNRLEPDELRKALRRFEHAAKLNPSSALAYAGIADCNLFLTHIGAADPAQAIPAARQAAERALQLDPKLPTSHVSAGLIAASDLDWKKAKFRLQAALALDPESAAAFRGLGLLASFEGDFNSARHHLHKSLSIDPLSAWTNLALAINEYRDHQFSRALSLLNELLDREPNYALAHYYRALTLGYLGRFEQAHSDLQKSSLGQDMIDTDSAWLDARAGNTKPALAILNQRVQRWRENLLPPSAITLVAIAAGNPQLAVESIKAYTPGSSPEIMSIRCDPRLDPIRGEPEFSALVAKIWPTDRK